MQWREGHRVRLLENGEEFFPRLFELIAQARYEILVETFIVDDDRVGHQLQGLLIEAAGRGVRVELTADGYGTADLSTASVEAMIGAGVRFRLYDPQPRVLSVRLNLFRRLHRKLVVIDSEIALVGGINFTLQHLREYGAQSKQDYAVEVEGPVIADIHRLVTSMPAAELAPRRLWRRRPRSAPAPGSQPHAGGAGAALVARDNDRHRNDIERVYRLGIRSARRRIVIANAYFFPGYRLLRDLRNAARRGVDVCLILQGKPDMPVVRTAATTLHDYLQRGGVRIFEYRERPLHAKVAVIDEEWSTVGSSNLDPLSLFLNLEANLVIRDRDFNRTLGDNLEELMRHHCEELSSAQARSPGRWRQLISFLAFHLVRHAPLIAGWLPGHSPQRSLPGSVSGVESLHES